VMPKSLSVVSSDPLYRFLLAVLDLPVTRRNDARARMLQKVSNTRQTPHAGGLGRVSPRQPTAVLRISFSSVRSTSKTRPPRAQLASSPTFRSKAGRDRRSQHSICSGSCSYTFSRTLTTFGSSLCGIASDNTAPVLRIDGAPLGVPTCHNCRPGASSYILRGGSIPRDARAHASPRSTSHWSLVMGA
jgi:hypothetical protein